MEWGGRYNKRKKKNNFNSQEEMQLCVQAINCLEDDGLGKTEGLFAWNSDVWKTVDDTI